MPWPPKPPLLPLPPSIVPLQSQVPIPPPPPTPPEPEALIVSVYILTGLSTIEPPLRFNVALPPCPFPPFPPTPAVKLLSRPTPPAPPPPEAFNVSPVMLTVAPVAEVSVTAPAWAFPPLPAVALPSPPIPPVACVVRVAVERFSTPPLAVNCAPPLDDASPPLPP